MVGPTAAESLDCGCCDGGGCCDPLDEPSEVSVSGCGCSTTLSIGPGNQWNGVLTCGVDSYGITIDCNDSEDRYSMLLQCGSSPDQTEFFATSITCNPFLIEFELNADCAGCLSGQTLTVSE